MRIAALIATESLSGPGRQLAALAAPLAQEGYELHVLVLARNSHKQKYARHLERLGVEHTVIHDGGPIDRSIPARVYECMRRLDARVLQTHGYKATAAGWLLHRARRIGAWIGFFHGATDKGMRDRLYQAVERRMLAAADRVVVVAGTQQRTFGSSALVIPNAVIADWAGPSASSAVLPDPPVRPVLGVIGRLSREKGVDVFLHSCADLRDRGFDFSALIVGDGPERNVLETLSQRLGLADVVSFIGHWEEISGVYPALDVVVLPSRSEGLPNVLLEALAADRRVVATDVGAIPDVLSLPGSGVLVKPGDTHELADGIVRALQESSAAESAARAAVVRRYSLAERVRRHVKLYQGLDLPAPAVLRSA